MTVVSAGYDLLNRVTSRTSPLGGVTSFTFDSFGRVLTQTDPDPDGSGSQAAAVTNYEYSAAGLSKITDALSHATTFVRDGQGRVTSMTDAQANVTSYAWLIPIEDRRQLDSQRAPASRLRHTAIFNRVQYPRSPCSPDRAKKMNRTIFLVLPGVCNCISL